MVGEKVIKSPEEEYLNSIGIYLDATTLIVHIDGKNRQPDLCELLRNYAIQFNLNNKQKHE